MNKVIKIVVFLVLGLARMQAQSDPVGDYIGNYFAMLNNLGDVTISLEDRRAFREELLTNYFLWEGSLLWNDLRPQGARYVKPREYLDNIVTDFPKGISFSFRNIQTGCIELSDKGMELLISLRSISQATGGVAKSVELSFLLNIQSITNSTMTARIKSVDRIEEMPLPEKKPVEARPAVTLTPVLESLESNMVYVSPGKFKMGCTDEQLGSCENDESPVHEVTLSGYFMGKYEVTQEEWRAVMGSDPEQLSFKGCNRCPVESVSWNEVQVFLRKLNAMTGKDYRLPTEAEWEYAARGGSKSYGSQYSGSINIGEVAWYNGNSGSKTHPVGQKLANELGLYDMSGNVWEWCWDWKDAYSGSSQLNPQGPYTGSYRVRRGGSWLNYADGCRVSQRGNEDPSRRYNHFGFRLARSSK